MDPSQIPANATPLMLLALVLFKLFELASKRIEVRDGAASRQDVAMITLVQKMIDQNDANMTRMLDRHEENMGQQTAVLGQVQATLTNLSHGFERLATRIEHIEHKLEIPPAAPEPAHLSVQGRRMRGGS